MAQPFLNVLRERTGETIHLAVMNETNIIYLDNLESESSHPDEKLHWHLKALILYKRGASHLVLQQQ
jgi:DNA-binding IclR family transcriptional regulator